MTTRIRISDLSPEMQARIYGKTQPKPTEKPAVRLRDSVSPEDTFASHCRRQRLPLFKREHLFAKASMQRLWRFDFAWPEYFVALECEGLVAKRQPDGTVLAGGRHATFQGFEGDCHKYASAAILGWSVIRFNQKLVMDGTAIDYTEQLLRAKGWNR